MDKRIKKVIESGSCCGCGACVALDETKQSKMIDTDYGPIPIFGIDSNFCVDAGEVCPCIGINYPNLYKYYFGEHPSSWLTGQIKSMWTGFANNYEIRENAASGGVITQTLIFLLENKIVDAVIVAKQGIPSPEKARAFIARTKNEIMQCSQSIYIPVSMLDILRDLDPDETYAITCLPEQSASLRALQKKLYKPALQVKYILGPYTGTAIYPAAIRCFLRSNNIKDNDKVTSLKWREGKWPGYLEIKTQSGKVLRSPKVYYNYLIPFFITQNSLQSMDFVNEFADLAVGDAWSPEFESKKEGYSVVVARTKEIENIINEMINSNILSLSKVDPLKASDMHGHMLDFKKRGGFIRNKLRKLFGIYSPSYGYKPKKIGLSRILVEIIISLIFRVGKTTIMRWLISKIPESYIGPIFNKLRLSWKSISRPTKRKGLSEYKVTLGDY